jgi:hypothetical protein
VEHVGEWPRLVLFEVHVAWDAKRVGTKPNLKAN